MLSYQHAYHAGNLADVHKHALLAWMLRYLTQKDKPLTYIETHAGRGLYDLGAQEALKTGEAQAGIARLRGAIAADHPYVEALRTIAGRYGQNAYPGSPMIAATLLRSMDTMHLAELHPAEHQALAALEWPDRTHVQNTDGLALAQSLCPPTPRRGLLLIDPSYEIKDEYTALPKVLKSLHRKWNVGVLALWYPLLLSDAHLPMIEWIRKDLPDAMFHEVTFPPMRDGHRMIGSGMCIVNAPYGTAEAAETLSALFATLGTGTA